MDRAVNAQKVPKRILSSLIASVSAGVVPRLGAPYIAIGRNDEIDALLSDLKGVSEGMASMRFIIGKYGSGKSFLMQLVRGYAIERGFVCADADLSPERRICGSKGAGLATYRELIRNMSSKSAPTGGAMSQIVAKWLSDIKMRVAEAGFSPESDGFDAEFEKEVFSTIRKMEDRVGGFDFARVLTEYYKAELADNDEKKSALIRWLRGEYSNKSEAREQTGLKLSGIIDDESWYDYIKLWASFVREIGYGGLVVFIDECVNLYKIPNRVSRENNYEKILSMFNDTLQGKAEGLAIILGGTPQFLEDTRRGLFSYEALKSRLSDSRFSDLGYRNMLNPVIRLRRLSDNELLALIARVTVLFEEYHDKKLKLTDTNMADFLSLCLARAGADEMITPREIIRDYITVLNILIQNDDARFEDIVKSIVKESTAVCENMPVQTAAKREYSPEDIEF
ncbi:MAG: ATP-binding protein [Clostridia bacterium]|nr:ATP-binding protein [Clostridia bacterium]